LLPERSGTMMRANVLPLSGRSGGG
jgi:hypothetical protein